MGAQQAFSDIAFPVRTTGGPGGLTEARYRIYSEPTKFTTVQATSAAEALQLSGSLSPYRILRDMPMVKVIIDQRELLG
jgi:hypothetical protein